MELVEKDIVKFILKELDKETSLLIIKKIQSCSYTKDLFLATIKKIKTSKDKLMEYELEVKKRKEALEKKLFPEISDFKEVNEYPPIKRFLGNDIFVTQLTYQEFSRNVEHPLLNRVNLLFENKRGASIRRPDLSDKVDNSRNHIKSFKTTLSSC